MNEIDYIKEFEKETGWSMIEIDDIPYWYYNDKICHPMEYYKAYSEWFKQKLNTVIEKIEAEIKKYSNRNDTYYQYNYGLKKSLEILKGGDK